MKQYQVFRFIDVVFDESRQAAIMRYALDDEITLTDEVAFTFEPADGYNRAALERVLRSLWLVNGVSYYKAAMAPQLDVRAAELTPAEAEFLSRTYRLGLGQLCYENQLSLDRVARFMAADGAVARPVSLAGQSGGSLVGLGGGKDSLVSTTLLDGAGEDFATFSATYMPESNPALARLAAAIGHEHLTIRRRFDPQLMELNRAGAYNGHVPVTAIVMLIGLAAAVLSNRRQVVMSNEASAGEGNAVYEGEEINHQYSKSIEFEWALAEHIRTSISPDLAVFSLLRPLGELQIAELFSRGPLERFAGLYSSCNRNFRHDATQFTWCGQCSKCAFVYLILAPFVSKDRLNELIGPNLLAQPSLETTYRELLGLSGHKPFECVGEIEECRAAATLALASGNYPELARFGVPPTRRDQRELGPSVMPEHYRRLVEEAMRA
ncbi:MAG TPA: endonuclease domain-containing protein [Candidatus Saccharimonadia bacterium]